MFFDRKELCTGVYLNILSTEKFKKNFVSVNFIIPHKYEYAAMSSLLSDVLTRGTVSHPTLRDIERELDECYSAQLSSYSGVRGETKIVSVSMDGLADHYALNGESIFRRTCDLLREVLFAPVTEGGVFSEEYVESEKTKLLASVQRRKNSKRHYALDKCKKVMCADEPFGIPSYGSEEEIERIDAAGLYDFYRFMIDNAAIELFYVGSESTNEVEGIFSRMFGDRPRSHYTPQRCPEPKCVSESRYFSEDADYKQSVLVMGYRTSVNAHSEDKYAFTLFNSVFGSGVNSKLFKVVREKMHLCYYASCAPELSKGVAFVSSGIDASNEQITTEAIKHQLEEVKNGNFSDDDVNDCKLALKNAYNELYDSPDGLCGWYLGRVIFGDTEQIGEVCEKLMSVTREEIISVASGMQLDTVFMLRGISKATDGGADDE